MNRKKKSRWRRTFLRTFIIGLIIAMSAISALCGMCAAYEGIRSVGFGDNRSAVELVRGADGYAVNFFDETFSIGFFESLADKLRRLYNVILPFFAENI